MEIKKWISRIIMSRTLWFNALLAAAGVAESAFAILQPHIPGNIYAYGFFVLTVGNSYFRAITTKSLKDK